MFGGNFYAELSGESYGALKSSMLLETIILVCLYFLRSFLPNFLLSALTPADLHNNKHVQQVACEVLTLLLTELTFLAKDNGVNFATYISDVISRCKLQKTVLYCLTASVYDSARLVMTSSASDSEAEVTRSKKNTLSENIVAFNENCGGSTEESSDVMHVRLLSLVRVIIALEEQILSSRCEPEPPLPEDWGTGSSTGPAPFVTQSLKFIPSRLLAQQPMFVNALQAALRQTQDCELHEQVLAMVNQSLTHFGQALKHIVLVVLSQLCRNLDTLATLYAGESWSRYTPTQSYNSFILYNRKCMCLFSDITVVDRSNFQLTT